MPLSVYPLHRGQDFQTDVWISMQAYKELGKHTKRVGPGFGKLVETYAKDGFSTWTGATAPIRCEMGEAFRIGKKHKFRLIGFFPHNNDGKFIISGADDSHQYGKGTTGQRVDDANAIKRNKSWVETEWPDETR
jgi:hypothetical protein